MDFDKLVDDLEEQGDTISSSVQSSINQPSLLSISSVNGETQNTYDNTSYYSFTVNLPRPMVDVENLQLLSSNIPQANANIADTACAFWYYRLSAYSGLVPNPNNLFMVRLLPSYYKREFIATPTDYGYNRTFKSYKDLATELAKCSVKDLALTNYIVAKQQAITIPSIRIPFLPNDISLTYSSAINKFQFTGLPTAPAYVVWNSGTPYNTNDVVGYLGIAYISISPETQSGNTPSTSPTIWSPLYNTEVVGAWDFDTTYPAGRYVSYNNTLYKSVYQTLQFYPDGSIAEWVSGRQYYRGSVVSYSGNNYTCVNPVANTTPPSSSTDWTALEWTNPYSYRTGMVVTYSGNYYVASTNISTPLNPSVNSFWKLVGTNFWATATLPNTSPTNVPCYNYLSTGYNDPAVAQAQATATQSWNKYNLYEAGQIVSYNGSYWINARQSQGETPFSRTGATTYSGTTQYVAGNVVVSSSKYYIATGNTLNVIPTPSFTNWQQENWTITSTTPPIIGLSSISKQLDMLTTSTYGNPTQTFYALQQPFGIVPQPYSLIPKRLLNTILGFTWNGQINPTIYSAINQSDTTPLIDAPTSREYNRLRPVPRYSVTGGVYTGTSLLLGDSSSTTYTYTADGYCNLVYSSIISIYTSIVGTSTLDTQRDTNLLGLVSMNVGNLGVSAWASFIDNPLLRVHGSLYSIYIELRDEFGDPYYLTNNAVSTFTFKVGYKAKS